MMSSDGATSVAALEALAGLLRVVREPEAVKADIAALQAKLDELLKAQADIATSREAAAKAVAEIGEAKRQLEVASGTAQAAQEEATAKMSELAASAAALTAAQKAHEEKSSKDSVALRAERDALTAAKAAHETAASKRDADAKIREDRVKSREVELDSREKAVAAREARAKEILDNLAALGTSAKAS